MTTERPQKFEEIIPAIEDNFDDPEPFIVTATPRSFNVRRKGEQGRRKEVLQLEPLTINSTPGNFRIIQPIQIVSTVSPPRWSIFVLFLLQSGFYPRFCRSQKKSQKLQKQIQSQRLQKSSRDSFSPSPTPPFQSSPVPIPHRPNSKPRPRFPKQSLTFVDNGLVAVLGSDRYAST